MSYYDWYYTKPKKKAKPSKPDPAHKPVTIEGKRIAHTFWGKAWCDNLERYGDYENRLPRGRTYVRQGTVLHLDIRPGKVEALVQGSSLYKVKVEVDPVSETKWKAMRQSCAGSIASQVELLQGQVPEEVLKRICDLQDGLFPSNKELRFSCSCPDWAVMCKHVAAACYGIGARLDTAPELFFTLRQVDMNELLADKMAAAAEAPAARGAKVLAGDGLEALFGLEMDGGGAPTKIAPDRTTAAKKASVKKPKRTAARQDPTKEVTVKKTADKPVRKSAKKVPAEPLPVKKPVAKKPAHTKTKKVGKLVRKSVKKAIAKAAVVKEAAAVTGKTGKQAAKKPVAAKSTTRAKPSGKPKGKTVKQSSKAKKTVVR